MCTIGMWKRMLAAAGHTWEKPEAPSPCRRPVIAHPIAVGGPLAAAAAAAASHLRQPVKHMSILEAANIGSSTHPSEKQSIVDGAETVACVVPGAA
jgi:hypothetical protein